MNAVPRFFQGKVVVITGSARGIGREVARQALATGARVVLNGREPVALAATARDLGQEERVLAVAADLSDPTEARRLVAKVLDTWGRIDVLINNAGLSMRGAFADLAPATVRTMIEGNLLTAVWATQAALPALRASRGRVVFVSSVAGVRGFPGVSLYSASKLALSAVRDSLAAEEANRGVVACLVHLAFTENDADKTILGPDGTPFRHHRRWSMTQAQAAAALLRAAARGTRVTTFTAQGRLVELASRWVPSLVDRFLAASAGKLHAVETESP